jgi:hypothetical protein
VLVFSLILNLNHFGPDLLSRFKILIWVFKAQFLFFFYWCLNLFLASMCSNLATFALIILIRYYMFTIFVQLQQFFVISTIRYIIPTCKKRDSMVSLKIIIIIIIIIIRVIQELNKCCKCIIFLIVIGPTLFFFYVKQKLHSWVSLSGISQKGYHEK